MKVRMAAEPESIEFDPTRSAICVVDMQNHDIKPGGYFDQLGIDTSHGEKVIQPIQSVLAAARAAALPIFYTKMVMPRDRAMWPDASSPWYWKDGLDKHKSDLQLERGMWIDGNWGAEIINELTPLPGELVIPKTCYSGFVRTELDLHLRRHGVRYLFFTGIGTPTCVEATARDAYFYEYWPIVLEDCCGAILPETHNQALFAIKRRYGWVSSSEEFIKALREATRPAAEV
jgi:ureidoacrylate peracid hydrolase